MALTSKTNLANVNAEDLQLKTVTLTFDASYPAGGYSAVAATVGFRELLALVALDSGAYHVTYQDNDTLHVYRQNATTGALQEIPTGTSLAGITARFLALGQTN